MGDNNHKEHTDNHNESSDHKKGDEEISLDFSSVKNFFTKKRTETLVLILLLLIPVFLTVFIRLQPEYLPTTADMAQNAVYNYYKNGFAQQVNAQYPNLPTAQKQKLVDDQFNQFLSANKDQMTQQIQQTSEYFKSGFHYEENNHTYTFIGDLDSYFYLRQARNMEEKGTYCDTTINGTCYDTLMVAPLGVPSSLSMQPWATYYLYKILHFINSNINLMQSAFYLQAVVSALAAIVAFLIGRKLMNNVGGFFAAMFVVLSPIYITRTIGGGHDQWAMIIPLITIYTFIEAFESKNAIKRYILLTLSALTMPLLIFGWSGWWYIFDILVAVLGVYVVYQIVKKYLKHKSWKNLYSPEIRDGIIIFVVFFVATGIFVSAFYSFDVFKRFYAEPLSNLQNLKAASATSWPLWPNILTTVAELNDTNIATVIGQSAFGINLLFSLALLGIIFTLVNKKPDFKDYILIGFSAVMYIFLVSSTAMNINPYMYIILLAIPVILGLARVLVDHESNVDIKISLLLVIWFAGVILTSVKGGVRFIVLMTPVISISLGIAIGYLFEYFSRMLEDIKLSKIISNIIVFAVLCLILIVPIQIGVDAGRTYMPSMTKGWWDSLTKIKLESKPDAIINSWWDFGHWFKFVAERRVTADGASQVLPVTQWLGRVLQTSDENTSIAILRMLDCGSNRAYEEVDKRMNDTDKSYNIVSNIIMMSKTDAGKTLSGYGFTSQEIDTILSYTHCSPPEDYFITSTDMVGKAGVWAHFGLWNFDKSYMINYVRPAKFDDGVKLLKERFNYSDDEASKIYYDLQSLQTDRETNDWISPWPSYATGSPVPCQETPGNVVYCTLNIGIGGNSQQNLVIEKTAINLTDPTKTQILLGIYDRTTNSRVGEQVGTWAQVVIADKEIKKYQTNNASIALSFMLNVVNDGNNTKYTALVADPLLIDSIFTKLYFLDGKYASHFEKFSDVTDITGQRVIIWKVKW